MKNLRRATLATLFALMLSAGSLWAQDDQPYPDEQQQASPAEDANQPDPPGRAARLQYMSGSVSIQPRGVEDWVAGTLNRPLTIADNVWTDKESRAELNVGTGMLRMGDETSLTLTNVSNNTVQVELHQGTLDIHVRHLFGGEVYEVDTPNMAFTIQKSGVYRFDVDPNEDATVVTVRKGEGDATGQGPAVRVRSNEQARFTDGTSLTHTVAEAPAYDGFDGWCAVRDKRQDSSLSARYVAPGVVGYEDLDDYGVWREEPQYGRVWVPVVAPGWAPYQDGHWIWVEPWGWTWVDDAPWGYAPFHYGRWVYTSGYWGWAPGPIYVRPVYAPALVAWFGGPGWGVNFGFGAGGGLGWCALGWGEPFYPWYHGGFNYFRSVNVSNTRIVNINNYWGHHPDRFGGRNFHYANLRAPGGITSAPIRTFQNGERIRGNSVRVSARDWANAPVGRMGITPSRNAMLGARAGERAAAPPTRATMRPVVSRMAPPASFNRGNAARMASAQGQRPFGGRQQSPLTPSRIIPHGPEQASGAVPSPGMRGMPRPGNSNAQRPAMKNPDFSRNNPQMARNVPRPPMASGPQSRPSEMSRPPSRGDFPNTRVQQPTQSRGREMNTPQNRGCFSGGPAQRSVPRPPSGFGSRENQPANSSRADSRPSGGSFGGNRPNTAIPRPSGPVRSASQSDRSGGGSYGGYSRQSGPSPSNRGSYGPPRSSESPRYSPPPSYRGAEPSYRGAPPSYRSSGPSYRGSMPSYHGGSPSYGGGSPSYRGASPSYGGGSPSYRGASPSYGGGGYRGGAGSPSFHGGGGAPSYHGGGGGSAPSSHGGGGGGGGRSSSGGHGGRR
jgi:hypothetical protein